MLSPNLKQTENICYLPIPQWAALQKMIDYDISSQIIFSLWLPVDPVFKSREKPKIIVSDTVIIVLVCSNVA